MRAIPVLIVAVACVASFGAEPATKPATEPAYIDTFAFLENFRIQHYLESAQELQKLEPAQRAERLKTLAVDPKHASEVFPLCRMLFEAKPKGEFRRPMIGAARFIDGRDYADWPMEPITIFEGVPILVVSGYLVGGFPEPPAWYVDYCLKECAWRDTKCEPVALEKRKQIVEKFIAANPKVQENADWLRRQAE
jgi:hypothetical protein